MEWWYVNTHLSSAGTGQRVALFASFFRVDVSESGASERTFGHFLTWALIDVDGQRFFPHTALDPRSPAMAVAEIDGTESSRDDLLRRALREVVARGTVPLPDRLLASDARVNVTRLDLDYDGNRFVCDDDGSYVLELRSGDGREGCRLRVTLEKGVVRHGDDGVVRGVDDERMFYYFSPRCRVDGAVLLDGAWIDDMRGSGWYDHEFGEKQTISVGGESALSENAKKATVGWNWLAVQLDNGYEISAYDLFDREDHSVSRGRWVIVVDPSGERRSYADFALDAHGSWTSTKTFNEYPTSYSLRVPEAGLSLEAQVVMPNQEVITIISAPAFWEGAVSIAGTMGGAPVSGVGFVERSGASVVDTTDAFFASVGRETRRAIDALLPDPLPASRALDLIGSHARPHFLDGVDLEQFSRTVVRPIREIILRGGKAWRSYGALACMDLVGGDSQPFAHWLALPELLHVGSLIIDDVQDASDVRRGGPSLHKLYGDALAINAGCASYFLAQLPIGASNLPAERRVSVYESYFESIRSAHAGQALDIDGLAALLPNVVESGEGALLERRVLAIHRLKSAAPAGALARTSAFIGGGTEEQADAVGWLFESYGVAFQIIDDVLNLRGFDENRKTKGEDIAAGKITAPVAKAMGRLPRDERRRLADILAARSTDKRVIREAVRLIDECGALDACESDARELIESAWQRLDPVVPDSQSKVRLRAFGWFVLERHY